MRLRNKIRMCLATIRNVSRKILLETLLFIVYFGVILSLALIYRWLLRRGLKRSRGSWAYIDQSTNTPNFFYGTV